jgi:predicted transcriptional regulator
MGRLKWKKSSEFDSGYGLKLEKNSDVERHKIIVKNEIMHALVNNPNGIGTSQLAKMVGIDRSNISSYLKKLVETGYAKRGAGLHGKYFPTDKIFKNHLFSSHFTGELFVSELLGKPNLILRDLPLNPDDADFRNFLPYLQKGELGLMRTMFEFMNSLGAFITYILIQALNPENKYLRDLKYVKKEIRDVTVQYWVKISMDAVLRKLLPKFKDSIRMELNSLQGDDEDPFGPFIDFGMSVPQFQVKKEVIDELLQAFSRLYPLMFSELENLRKKLPIYIYLYKEHKEYLKYQEPNQKKCKHDFKNSVSVLIEDEGRKFWDYAKQHNSLQELPFDNL